ncbi:MAG: phosphohistidine phosphatase SixA [Verrucomicrobiota bacterium]
MRLYFLRHADASPGADDAARPLTTLGEKQSKVVGHFLKQIGVMFDAAYSSPLVRAHQTADLVLPITNHAEKLSLQVVEALLNETSQAEFDRWLKKIPDGRHVLLVGHAPSLPERACHLLGVANAEVMKLPKAGLACIKTDDRETGSLKLFISSKVLGE